MKLPNSSGTFDCQPPRAFATVDVDPVYDLTANFRHIPKRPTLTLR